MQHGAGLNEIALAFVNTTSRSYFGKMNSTLGSVVPLAMFSLLRNCLCWRCSDKIGKYREHINEFRKKKKKIKLLMLVLESKTNTSKMPQY